MVQASSVEVGLISDGAGGAGGPGGGGTPEVLSTTESPGTTELLGTTEALISQLNVVVGGRVVQPQGFCVFMMA